MPSSAEEKERRYTGYESNHGVDYLNTRRRRRQPPDDREHDDSFKDPGSACARVVTLPAAEERRRRRILFCAAILYQQSTAPAVTNEPEILVLLQSATTEACEFLQITVGCVIGSCLLVQRFAPFGN
uniref:Uncharacterized protein n=1 Tax=Plectus sambesii TaxID=2011161 RepID=A0A914WFM1_9BILA